jgi:hypothetical protein
MKEVFIVSLQMACFSPPLYHKSGTASRSGKKFGQTGKQAPGRSPQSLMKKYYFGSGRIELL